MDIDLSPRGVIEHLLVLPYPDGDVEASHRAGDMWQARADVIRNELQARVRAAAKAVADSGSAESIDAFAPAVGRLDSYLERIAAACAAQSRAAHEFGNELEKIQNDLDDIAWKTLASIAATVVFGFVTGPLSDAATWATRMMFRVKAISDITGWAGRVAWLIQKVLYYAVDSLAYAAMDQGAQVGMTALRRDPIDWSENLHQATLSAGANAPFNAAQDAQYFILKKAGGAWLSSAAKAGNPAPGLAKYLANADERKAARIGVRFTSSTFVYTPAQNLEERYLDGKDNELLPNRGQVQQKVAIHVGGRLLVDAVRMKYNMRGTANWQPSSKATSQTAGAATPTAGTATPTAGAATPTAGASPSAGAAGPTAGAGPSPGAASPSSGPAAPPSGTATP